MQTLRSYVVFAFLIALKRLARLVYRFEMTWFDTGEDRSETETGEDPWRDIRVAAVLHHTSLFDLLFVAGLPNRMLWLLARSAVAPGADVTLERPVVGALARLFVHRMIPVTRRRDETWDAMLDAIDEDALIVLAPEGRMMRRNGLDKNGRPMTVRGGIADILEAVEPLPGPDRLLLLYSQGLHHIQAPGERLPRLFEIFSAKLERISITDYLAERRAEAERGGSTVAQAVIRDLEARRGRHCPALGYPDSDRLK